MFKKKIGWYCFFFVIIIKFSVLYFLLRFLIFIIKNVYLYRITQKYEITCFFLFILNPFRLWASRWRNLVGIIITVWFFRYTFHFTVNLLLLNDYCLFTINNNTRVLCASVYRYTYCESNIIYRSLCVCVCTCKVVMTRNRKIWYFILFPSLYLLIKVQILHTIRCFNG